MKIYKYTQKLTFVSFFFFRNLSLVIFMVNIITILLGMPQIISIIFLHGKKLFISIIFLHGHKIWCYLFFYIKCTIFIVRNISIIIIFIMTLISTRCYTGGILMRREELLNGLVNINHQEKGLTSVPRVQSMKTTTFCISFNLLTKVFGKFLTTFF